MIPVVLCGGSGLRLWPVSEKKPFYRFFDHHSLLEMSLKRLENFEPILIVSTESLKPALEKILKDKTIKTEVIYEPKPRNTACSIALLCHLLSQRKQEKDILGIFPSDHFIGKEPEFQNLISSGIQTAKEERKIVTFGLFPRFERWAGPEASCPGYGYIKVKNTIRVLNHIPVKQACGFVEKPDASTSLSLAKEGNLWNSGIFLCPVDVLIQYFKDHLSHLWRQILRIQENSIHSIYENLKPVSFDKGIMEKISQFLCLPCDIDWSDLGSWDRIAGWDQHFPGKLHNKAHVISKDSNRNFVFSSTNQRIGMIDIQDTLVVHRPEGLLIANRNRGEDVKYIGEKFKSLGEKPDVKCKILDKEKPTKEWVEKPWGAYRVLWTEGFFKYKELKVKPGHQLSYQSHRRRSEHWLVVSGFAEVTLEGNKYKLKANEHLFVAQGAKHRLKNPGEKELLLLEIQIGDYLEEDDIVRYADDYGRTKKLKPDH